MNSDMEETNSNTESVCGDDADMDVNSQCSDCNLISSIENNNDLKSESTSLTDKLKEWYNEYNVSLDALDDYIR